MTTPVTAGDTVTCGDGTGGPFIGHTASPSAHRVPADRGQAAHGGAPAPWTTVTGPVILLCR